MTPAKSRLRSGLLYPATKNQGKSKILMTPQEQKWWKQ